nr:zinc finger, CCHC-type [Tanacetum cinerariifolium]
MKTQALVAECNSIDWYSSEVAGKGVIICLYIDDMLIFGTDQVSVDLTKEFLSSRFSMKDMGGGRCYPGPDIAFAVGKLSRYTSNPRTQNWQAIQRVLKYLKKTMNYRLVYSGYPSVLEGYTNASCISNTEDNSSTSGCVFLLGGSAIFWASKKQTCITGSTMESEFVALAAAGKEAEWLKNLLLEIPLWFKPITPIFIRCDSAATLAKAYSQMYNGKSRHLGVTHSMIRELIMNDVMDLCKVATDNDDSGFESVHLPDDDDSTLNNMPTTQLLETFIEDVINKKETLDSTMDKVTRLMIEVEREEKAAEEAKEEAIKSGFDILVKMDECKQAQRSVKETNDMLARKVCIHKAVLATKMEVLQRQAAHTLEDGDRSLEVLEEQENEAISQIALAHEELRQEKMVEESKKLKQEALEIHKELLVYRGDVVHMLSGGISAKCQDVNSVKKELDQVILSGEILSSTRIPSILALQSTIKTNDPVENSSESESEEVNKLHGSQMLLRDKFEDTGSLLVVSRKFIMALQMEFYKPLTGNEIEQVYHKDDSSLMDVKNTSSRQLCCMLDSSIRDVREKKKTIVTTMELVNWLMGEVEKEERAAEEAKEETACSSLDILAKVEECKQALLQAQEANNTLVEKLNAEKDVLATKMEVLRGRVTNMLDDEDRSLDLLNKMAVEEYYRLKEETFENNKLQKILDDRHQSVEMLHEEISEKCKDVNLIKEGVDPSVPLLTYDSTRSSLKKLEENKNVVAAITEEPQTMLSEGSVDLKSTIKSNDCGENHKSIVESKKSADTDNRKAGANDIQLMNSSLEKPKERKNVAAAMTEEPKELLMESSVTLKSTIKSKVDSIEAQFIETIECIRAVIIILGLLWFAVMFCWKICKLLV